MNRTPRSNESGFALLIVFLMAAAVALMLYHQLPRVAFESQRDKEQTLIDRGEQYRRGVALYFVAFKKFPAKMEDLENTNNQRFLRRRYIDPLTGKDEWRLIHANGAGQLTDSLVQKPPAPPTDEKTQTAANGANPNPASAPATNAGGANQAQAPPEMNAAAQRRPSDRPLVPSNLAGIGNTQPAVDPNDPRTWPPIFLQPATPPQPGTNQPGLNPQFPGQQMPGQTGQFPLPGQFPGQQFPGQPPFPGQQAFPGQQPGQQLPGQQNFQGQQPLPGQQPYTIQVPGQPDPNQQFPVQTGVQQAIIPGQTLPPGIPGQPQPGFNPLNPPPNTSGGPDQIPAQFTPPPNQQTQIAPQGIGGPNPNGQGGAPNPALGIIGNFLRTPQQGANTPNTNNTINAGGLVGVASTFTGPSIKVYRERSKYNEWEFIFDLKQGLPGQAPPAQGRPQQNPNPLGANSMNATPAGDGTQQPPVNLTQPRQ